jgi:hypothetical protein
MAVIVHKRDRANKRAGVTRRRSVLQGEQPVEEEEGDRGVDEHELPVIKTQNQPRGDADGERNPAQRSGVGGKGVGVSKKTGNSFHNFGNPSFDAGGESADTPAMYAVPYESAPGNNTGNTVYDYDTFDGAYSKTVGATPYETLPTTIGVEA